MRTRGLFFAMMALLSLGACSEKSTTPNDEAATGDVDVAGDQLLSDADTYDFWKDGPQRPHPVDWGTCPEGWEPKETKDEEGNLLAKYCEPPLNWRPAAPVDWGTCPEGWEPMEEKDEDGNLLAKYCEPILPPDGTECEPGYFTMFGSVDCQRIGDECPDGEFADIPTDAGTEIVYVFEGDSIQAAIDAAKDGAVIAIGKGTFDEFVTITDKNITLWGACVEGTILSPTTPMSDEAVDAIIRIDGADPEKKVVVKNLTLTGGQRQGMYITGITAEISKIAIVSVMGQGLLVDYGGTVSLSSAMVKGTLPLADKTRGRGIAAYDNISLFISKVLVERNKELGIMVATTETTSKSSFDATDLIVRNTASQESDLMWGRGVDISDAVTSTLSRVLVEKNRECGIFSGTWTEGTRNSFTATHLIVRDTQSEEINKWYGRGITLRDNIDATLTHVLVERNREVGLSANTFSDGAKGSMNVTDLIIRDTRSEEESQTLGDGLIVKDSVIAIINRALVERNREVGITIASSSAQTQGSFSATDLTVRNTLEKESDGYAGRGFWILDHPTVVLARTVVEGNRDIGIAISYSAPQEGKGGVLATDLVVRGTVSRTSDQQLGLGISIQDSVEADLDRVLIEQNQYIGLQISTPSDGASGGIDATHLVVRDTGAQKSDAMFGRGISVQGAITSVFDKTLVKGNKEVGLFAGSSTPESPCALSATDLIVIETQSQESDKMFGRGVVARDNVSASFSRALIDSNREVGLVVRTDLPEATGSFDATDLVVRNTWPQESDQTVGRGIDITDNITANINRVLVEQNRDVGIFVATHTDGVQGRFEGKDVMVRNTYAQESDKQWGSGIVFQDNIQSTLKNIAVENNRELGVQLINGDAAGVPIATFVNVIISDTMVRECYELDIDCGYALEAPFGHGLGIYYGAEATLVNVVIDGNQHGLQIKGSKVFAGENCSLPFGEEESETVCLHIINNETGINAFDLPADYDVFAAFANTSTWYEGNGTPFSGDPEDVPEPPDPINDPTEN